MDKNFGTARDRFNTAYATLFDFMADYPAEKREQSGACGAWSPRQILAHFTGWITRGIEQYAQYAEAGTFLERVDADAFNASQVSQRDHLDWDATIADLKAAVDAFNAQSDQISNESQDKLYVIWQVELAKDCEIHSQELRDFLEV